MEAQIAAAGRLPHVPHSDGGGPAIAFLAQTYASLDDADTGKVGRGCGE